MPETSATSTDRKIISSSSWWIWILLAVGVVIILLVIYGGWRLFRGATQAVREEVPESISPTKKQEIRFVRTATEVVVIDDPIIPEGETSVEVIADDFDEYQGKKVIISGTVSQLESTSFFSVTQGEGTIAVLALPEAIKTNDLETASNPERQYVRVTGIVKLLTKEREKTEFGLSYRDLDEAFWQDKMIIEAETIEVIDASTT